MRSRSSSKSSIVELTDMLLLSNANSSVEGGDHCIESGFEGGGSAGEADGEAMWEEILRLRRRIAALEMTNERLLLSASESPPRDRDGGRADDVGEIKVHDDHQKRDRTGSSVTFFENLKDRSSWLVGLLIFQSCSGFILARNDALLTRNPVIVHFLTMLVGAGGNAGNQASVRVIRGLAVGTLNDRTIRPFLRREVYMALALTVILSLAGFLRAAFLSGTPPLETAAVTTSLALIVLMSVCLGAVLPLLLRGMGFDPAHSSTTIQVVMDILGVLLTVRVSAAVLGGL